jgi:putative sigma-54 modulation protein
MKVTFTGKQEKLTGSQERKLATRFAKLSKMLERRGEKDAKVVLGSERHLHHAEVTVQYYDHSLVGAGSDPDQFAAMMDAVEKLEKQVLRTRNKWRDTKREYPRREVESAAAEAGSSAVPAAPQRPAGKRPPAAKAGKTGPPAPGRARPANGKPMTADEAMLAMDESQDYMVFRDADTNKMNVLVRRRDGGLDLVEP